MNWNLDDYYKNFDEKFNTDLKTLQNYEGDMKKIISYFESSTDDLGDKIKLYINTLSEFHHLYVTMASYCRLRAFVNTGDIEAKKQLEIVSKAEQSIVQSVTIMTKYLTSQENLLTVARKDSQLEEYIFFLEELVRSSQYLLNDQSEGLLAKLQQTASTAWETYQDHLISNHRVNLNGEEKLLTEVLNMAYDSNREVRKVAYEAEIASYKKVEEGIAASLNAIKGEAITIANEHGYKSPLDMTIKTSRINDNILNSLIAAVEENLVHFRRLLKAKAKYLGHNQGLPWYDLYASVVQSDEQIPFEEGMNIVLEAFNSYSSELHDFAKHAYESEWIDVYPKKGKVGGAFCAPNPALKQSRILLNYGNSISDVSTLAHELGHGFHNHCLRNEKILNYKYPMTLAETASNFCEIITKNYLYEQGDEKRKLAMLDEELTDAIQIIVDIYSRFIFEKNLFEARTQGPLSVEQIKNLMLNAQKQAYGDGLDQNYFHPYMWTWCKC